MYIPGSPLTRASARLGSSVKIGHDEIKPDLETTLRLKRNVIEMVIFQSSRWLGVGRVARFQISALMRGRVACGMLQEKLQTWSRNFPFDQNIILF